MIALGPILIALVSALIMYQFSAWRTGRMLDAKSVPLKDSALVPVFDRLARVLDLKHLPVNIYEIDPVNGLAAPDGRIFITRGFYEKYRSGEITAEELTGVVAHELGHVSLGHSTRRMVDFTGQNAIRVALAMVLGRFVPFVGIMIANLISSLLMARLSRQDEYEADAWAAALMTKAGLGVRHQISLLRKLEEMHGMAGRAPVWTASHPDTADRIAALRTLEQGWQVAAR